jgi:hypothetical protein
MPGTARIRWQAAPRAQRYRVQVDTDIAFTHPLLDAETQATEVDVPGLSDGATYYWRVKAIGAGGESAYSAPSRFTTWASNLCVLDPYWMPPGDVVLEGAGQTGATDEPFWRPLDDLVIELGAGDATFADRAHWRLLEDVILQLGEGDAVFADRAHWRLLPDLLLETTGVNPGVGLDVPHWRLPQSYLLETYPK